MFQHKSAAILVVVLAMGLTAAGYATYNYYYLGDAHAACPGIFANLTFQNTTGFVSVSHPDSVTEFVLAPNTAGQVDVAYSSPTNNLTQNGLQSELIGPVVAWEANSTNISVQASTDVNVSSSSHSNQTLHTVVVHYIITAGGKEALYLLGFPSTCRGVYLNVGESQYPGPFP